MKGTIRVKFRPDIEGAGGERPAAGGVPPIGKTQVSRSIRPGKAGTIRLLKRFGPALYLVRYRYDTTGLYRYTTVELLIDSAPTTRGRRLDKLFTVQIALHEQRLQDAVKQHGGKWNSKVRRWILSGRAIQKLQLIDRVDPPNRKTHPSTLTQQHTQAPVRIQR
ncbi:MAG: hypothetical protein IPH51_13065 [Rubrivivax sp.]|nr:hypothetical protein [Rubrivivax sp.]